MPTFVRISPDRPHVDDGVRVLAPEDYQAVASADDLLADARARADAIVEEAKAHYEAEKQRGYDEGMAAAKPEIAEQMMTLVDRSVGYLANAEHQVAETVLICLRKVLGEFPEEELVLRAARAGLAAMRNEERVTLRVRPEVETALRDRVDEILRDNNGIGYLEIAADGGLPERGCRLETELGIVDASIDQQIAALETVVRAQVKGLSSNR